MSTSGDIRRPSRLPGGGWPLELLKLAVSVTLLALILRRFSWDVLRAELQRTHVPALVLPFGLILASNVLGAVQWRWMLRAAGIALGFGAALRAYVTGLFLNNFLLGNVGGDLYKIYTVGLGAGELGRVASATIVDRLVGLSALCALAVVASVADLPQGQAPFAQTAIVLAFSLAVMVLAAVLLHPRWGGWLERRFVALPLGSWSPRVGRLFGYLRAYWSRPRLLNGAFLLSLWIQAARVIAHFCVGLAMGWPLQADDVGKFFLVIPILGLLISLPISVGGWGVREWAGVALFAPMGHGGKEAVTLLVVTAGLTFIASLAGAIPLVLGALPGRTVRIR